MFLSEPDSDHAEHSDISRNPDMVVVKDRSAAVEVSQSGGAKTHAGLAGREESTAAGRKIGTRWWMVAAGFAVLLALLAAAGIYLLTRNHSIADELVIYTVPSGAEIKIDSKTYGLSPVKIEKLPWGTFNLTITKEGFEPINQVINVAEPQPRLEFILKALLPSGMSPEQAIPHYQAQAQAAFDRGHYWAPPDESALKYITDLLTYDNSSQFALEMKERIRAQLHQEAQAARSRGDIAQAQDLYKLLKLHFPDDREVDSAAFDLTNQIRSQGNQKIVDFTRKAAEAFQAGRLLEPERSSAYYYTRQALAIDPNNAEALEIRDQVIITVGSRTDVERVTRELERAVRLYPQDPQLSGLAVNFRAKLDEIAQDNDAGYRRLQGLKKYQDQEYRAAIPDLEFAMTNGRSSTDVRYALASSYMQTGQTERASNLFKTLGPNDDESYRSSLGALGDIALSRGQTSTALDHFKKARDLGGSTLYTVAKLNDKIEQIEKQQRVQAAAPVPFTIHVKHSHGTLKGSCDGTLTVNSSGVRFDSDKHPYSYSLMGVEIRVEKDGFRLSAAGKTETFKSKRADAEQFKDVLNRYQHPPS